MTATLASAPEPKFRNSIGQHFRRIPAGSFKMGNPDYDPYLDCTGKPHVVQLSKAFWMSETTVTQGQWLEVMGTEPWLNDEGLELEGVERPAVNVSWHDARDFCHRLSERDGRTYRLPTEAQWEYACRAGSESLFYFGDELQLLVEHAWFRGNADWDAHPVAQKKPNPWGLYDMAGNVHEWCLDRWSCEYPAEETDPLADQGNAGGLIATIRGGSWGSDALHCRAAERYGRISTRRYIDVGFRVWAASRKQAG